MQALRKAFGKEDSKKQKTGKINATVTIRPSHQAQPWNDLDSIFEKKAEKGSKERSFDRAVKKVIEKHFGQNSRSQVSQMAKELQRQYLNANPDLSHMDCLSRTIPTINRLAQQENEESMKKMLTSAVENLHNFIKEKQRREKEQKLHEFEEISLRINPSRVEEKKPEKIEKAEKVPTKKLAYSTSATNLKIRVTREEYMIAEEQKRKAKKSLQPKNKSKSKSKGSSTSQKGLQAGNKLQQFLKQGNPSKKLVKTKIEYDYSAILAASKSNIHPRNRTMVDQPRNEKEVITKAAHGNPNQAFVFYRPSRH